MNENIDLTKILKDCPKGFELYSPICGSVFIQEIHNTPEYDYPIECKSHTESHICFTKEGRFLINCPDAECLLFPSKNQRDWNKFIAPWYKNENKKFDPKILKPFDKVLVRDSNLVADSSSSLWKCQILSHIKEESKDYPYVCINEEYSFCIPFNDDTKHLVGTNKQAPEFYRYWEN